MDNPTPIGANRACDERFRLTESHREVERPFLPITERLLARPIGGAMTQLIRWSMPPSPRQPADAFDTGAER